MTIDRMVAVLKQLIITNYNNNTNGAFFFSKLCALYLKKNAIFCLFLKNDSPSKGVLGFILHNTYLSMMEGFSFYALYKSRMLLILCNADDFCSFLKLPEEI